MKANLDILGSHFTMENPEYASSYDIDVCDDCGAPVISADGSIGVLLSRHELLKLGKKELEVQPDHISYRESDDLCVCEECYDK